MSPNKIGNENAKPSASRFLFGYKVCNRVTGFVTPYLVGVANGSPLLKAKTQTWHETND